MTINSNTSTDPTNILFGGAKPKAAATPDSQLTSKDTFLQLLVAQMKYQDPLKPNDGVQFLTQLAQFTDLEQTMNMNQELEAIHQLLAEQAAKTDSTTTDSTTTTDEAKN
jgi:flagellar basal-body rod modification protein FlgD